jgi:putative addiction module CopG family antidote
MLDQFPPEINDFVKAQIAAGAYRSEDELVLDALRAFRELKLRHEALLDEVQQATAQADCGELHPLDTEATKAEARRRLAARSS